MGWVCPRCGRRFARANQWHSCAPRTIASHFAGTDPTLRQVFDHLMRELGKTGPLRVDAVKTSINLISRRHFGGIVVRRGYLRLGFLARQPIASARIVRREKIGPNRVGHTVVVRCMEDVDAELLRWLSAAQRLQS